MSKSDYTAFGVWQRAYGSEALSLQEKEAVETLTAAYRAFWRNAVDLSKQIAKLLPGLTLHDEEHSYHFGRALI